LSGRAGQGKIARFVCLKVRVLKCAYRSIESESLVVVFDFYKSVGKSKGVSKERKLKLGRKGSG
jgi:hypothetical protein